MRHAKWRTTRTLWNTGKGATSHYFETDRVSARAQAERQSFHPVPSGPTGAGTSVMSLPSPVEEFLAGAPKYVDVRGEGGSVLAYADLLSTGSSSA
jgi:hypothetical protein